ncbi:MAG: hypothetical protein FWH20_02495 [Oscillospiraceae bacterium]|nr:hypothetical protein [Oscillospiraceae bacterium]
MKLRRILAVVLAVAMVAGFALSAAAHGHGAPGGNSFTYPGIHMPGSDPLDPGNTEGHAHLKGPWKTNDSIENMSFAWRLAELTTDAIAARLNTLTVSGRINLGETVLGTNGFLYFDQLGVDQRVELVALDAYGEPLDVSTDLDPVIVEVARFRVDGNDGLTIRAATDVDIFEQRFLSPSRCDINSTGGFLETAVGGPYDDDLAGFRTALNAELHGGIVGSTGAVGTAFAMNSGLGRTALPFGRINYPVTLETKPLTGAQRDAYVALKDYLKALADETGETFGIGVFADTLSFTGTSYAGAPTSFADNTGNPPPQNRILKNDVTFQTIRENMSESGTAPTFWVYGNVVNLFSNGGQIQAQFWRQRFGSYVNSQGKWTDFGYDVVYADTRTALTSQSIYEIARAADANKKATLTFKLDMADGIYFDNDGEFHTAFGAPAGSTTALSRAARDTFISSRRSDGTWWINWNDDGWNAVNTNFEWGYSTFKGIDAPNFEDFRDGRVTEITYEFDANTRSFDGLLAQMYSNMTSKDNMNLQYIHYLPDEAYIQWTYNLAGAAGGFRWNFDDYAGMNSGWVTSRGTGNTALLIGRATVTDITLTFSGAGSAPSSDVSTAAALAILKDVAAGVAGASTADALAILRQVAAQ